MTAAPAFREHPLDGAMLYFEPRSGLNVRVTCAATESLRRRAPRVVMFGITNRCNLRCGFCSRDVERASSWTVDSAYEVLADLADAGVLEVAFGGGEPFVFPGFVELAERLRRTTPLAINVTTNGTRLDAFDWQRLAGAFGQVRISLYDGVEWRRGAVTLARAGQTWGANVLVDSNVLRGLPLLLDELARLGARDVSLLSYVGPDPSLHLERAGEERLAAIARTSPLPVRVSVCFGDRLDVPRLFDDADCGAGRDFVSITPDRRVQSCSFQEVSFPIASAADVLRVWSESSAVLARATPRRGCARGGSRSFVPPARGAELRVWRAFSGNNSGECVMVARFVSVEDADAYLAELLPGFVAGEAYSPPWRTLFEEERVSTPGLEASVSPDELVRAGRTVFARTRSAPEDDFPELRALAWKRGALVLAGGIHEHATPAAIFAIRPAAIEPRLDAIRGRLASLEQAFAVRHGDVIHGVMPLAGDLASTMAILHEVASGDALAVELSFLPVDRASLDAETKRLGVELTETPRVAFTFWGSSFEERQEAARTFAAKLDDVPTTIAENVVLADPAPNKRRLAVLGHRAGAFVRPLLASRVVVHAQLWRQPPPPTKGKKTPPPPVVQIEEVRAALAPRLRAAHGPKTFELQLADGPSWRQGVKVTLTTDAPKAALESLQDVAGELEGVSLAVGISDTSSLAFALRRVIEEVRAR